MAAAGYLLERVFGALNLVPARRVGGTIATGPAWDYTSVLNIVFALLAAVLVIRFLRTGGPAMLRMMGAPEGHGMRDDATLEHHAASRNSRVGPP
jgi:uncharacterized protein